CPYITFSLLSFPRLVAHRLLPSFPTRRSSDLALERKQLLQLFRREAPVPHDLERASAVRLPFAHAHHERRLAGRVVHDQRVVERSEEHSLNSSHVSISYAVFCLKKKKNITNKC